MSRGRHRGRRAWGILPPTGLNFVFLPRDIAVLSVRYFLGGIGAGALGLVFMGAGDPYHRAAWASFAVSAALLYIGRQILHYGDSILGHFKAQQADRWIHAVYASRVELLAKREESLTRSVAELNERFEEEKAALKEIREERMAEERMMGFLEGLQKYPELQAHHANPRNRLRVVKDSDEESA